MDGLRWRWVRLLTGGVAILGSGLLAPASARGSCGDYVHVGGVKATVPPSPVKVPPCSGPSCSHGSGLPVSGPAVTAVKFEDGAALRPCVRSAAPAVHGHLLPEARFRVLHRAGEVFRPPRRLPLSHCR